MESDFQEKLKTNRISDEYVVYWNQRLGTGISGPVRLCSHKVTGARFALKCLPDTPRSRTEVQLQLLCSKRDHVVTVYDVYANDVKFPSEPHPRGRLLVVMELMEGGELFDRISQEKFFTERKAAKYMHQIVHAVQCCHLKNVAHRDLKPENLLLKDNSEHAMIKLSDFGFAKVDDGTLKTPHFTPYYVAPEVLQAQRLEMQKKQGPQPTCPYTYDKSCDMWSLGVILYIMLCGYPPFYTETPSRPITDGMKFKIMSGEYEFPEDDWVLISADAKDVVRRLLHVEPSHRMTVDDVLRHTWLSDAPDTALRSPAIIPTKEGMEDIKLIHSAHLTAQRLPEFLLTLKPMQQVNNPIIKKRLHKGLSSIDACQSMPPHKQLRRTDEQVESLKDVIQFCSLPTKEKERDCVLNSLVCRALQFCSDNTDVDIAIKDWHWNGREFCVAVDKSVLAARLREIVVRISDLAGASNALRIEKSYSKPTNPEDPNTAYMEALSPTDSNTSEETVCSPGRVSIPEEIEEEVVDTDNDHSSQTNRLYHFKKFSSAAWTEHSTRTNSTSKLRKPNPESVVPSGNHTLDSGLSSAGLDWSPELDEHVDNPQYSELFPNHINLTTDSPDADKKNSNFTFTNAFSEASSKDEKLMLKLSDSGIGEQLDSKNGETNHSHKAIHLDHKSFEQFSLDDVETE